MLHYVHQLRLLSGAGKVVHRGYLEFLFLTQRDESKAVKLRWARTHNHSCSTANADFLNTGSVMSCRAKRRPPCSPRMSKQTIWIFVQGISTQRCFFHWVRMNSGVHPSHSSGEIDNWVEGVRRMIDWIALTNAGRGRRLTVAVPSTLAILLPPHHRFNPSHTQMS